MTRIPIAAPRIPISRNSIASMSSEVRRFLAISSTWVTGAVVLTRQPSSRGSEHPSVHGRPAGRAPVVVVDVDHPNRRAPTVSVAVCQDVNLGSDIGRSLAGPYLAACALLVIAGAGKVVRPRRPGRRGAAGLRIPGSGIVAFGLVELGRAGRRALLGGRVRVRGRGVLPPAAAAFAVRLLLRAPTTRARVWLGDAVVTRAHVVIDVAARAIVARGGIGWFAVRADRRAVARGRRVRRARRVLREARGARARGAARLATAAEEGRVVTT